jgi:hypothetical protein
LKVFLDLPPTDCRHHSRLANANPGLQSLLGGQHALCSRHLPYGKSSVDLIKIVQM